MVYLVDTNVLLRFADRRHPQHPVVRSAVRKLRLDAHQLRIASQNCVEFWNVATRPLTKTGWGMTPPEVDRLLRLVERIFPLFPDTASIYREWRRLVVDFGVSGVQVHDARLVAVMQANSVTHILTFNTPDFKRYSSIGIVAIDPTTV